MSDKAQPSLIDQSVADPMTEPFWLACLKRRLVIQKCTACGAHQFYPRPFCLACESGKVEWVEASGHGVIYSVTTVRIPVVGELPPPYILALVDLEEGPRLLSNIEGGDVRIGDRVSLGWREREGLPPVPIFRPARP